MSVITPVLDSTASLTLATTPDHHYILQPLMIQPYFSVKLIVKATISSRLHAIVLKPQWLQYHNKAIVILPIPWSIPGPIAGRIIVITGAPTSVLIACPHCRALYIHLRSLLMLCYIDIEVVVESIHIPEVIQTSDIRNQHRQVAEFGLEFNVYSYIMESECKTRQIVRMSMYSVVVPSWSWVVTV